jgi:hypothetical protein
MFIMYRLIKGHLSKNAALIRAEAEHAEDFMRLLMKQRNTGCDWTGEERLLFKRYLRRLAAYVPVFLIFLLPFGTLLIPVLAEVLDRRKVARRPG